MDIALTDIGGRIHFEFSGKPENENEGVERDDLTITMLLEVHPVQLVHVVRCC